MHNLGTVYRFELIRTLKKKSFWITALSFPIILAVVVMIIFFSNRATSDVSEQLKKESFSIRYTDESGLVKPEVASAIKAKTTTDKQEAIDQVKAGQLDAYFYFPKDLAKDKPEVYGRDVGLFNNGKYQGVAEALLQQSVNSDVSPSVQQIISGKLGFDTVTYKDGVEYNGFMQLIAPGLFLVLFYFIIALFGNQMLTSTIEEKENRVIEMILTTIKADTLILGKILSLLTLVAIQLVVLLVPVVVGYLTLGDRLNLPNIDLSNIPLDPLRISIGAGIFILSLLLFTGLLVAIGAASPTAKEAGGFFGAVMIFIFGPLYAAPLFVSAADSTIVQVLSLVPFTAPIPLMLRNAVGNLTVPEALLSMGILLVTTIIVFALAVRLFRYGALEYNRRLSLKEIVGRK